MLGKEATEAKMKYAHVVKGELEVKYNTRILASMKIAKFDFWVLCFPLSPGPITLTTSVVQIIRKDTRHFFPASNYGTQR
jgi:hypothetical protein